MSDGQTEACAANTGASMETTAKRIIVEYPHERTIFEVDEELADVFLKTLQSGHVQRFDKRWGYRRLHLASPPPEVPSEGARRPTIVCLCGSGRFREAFERAEFDETLARKIVLTIGCNTHDIARSKDLEHHKPMLDELHLRKIDLADEVLVVNVGGYIGSSTRNEVSYATKIGKPIRYLEDITPPAPPSRDAEEGK